MTVLLAIVAGAALGAVLARGDFCFHSTWRRAFATPRETSLLRAYVVVLLVSTPIVQLLIATDVIDPFIPPFAPGAAIFGGLLFGIGMVVAKTCISGIFYKLGAGMLAMVVALAAWAVGDIVTWRGPLQDLRESLNDDPITSTNDAGAETVATVSSLLGPAGVVLLIVVGVALVVWVARDDALSKGSSATASPTAIPEAEPKLGGVHLGLATSAVIILAWLLTRWHGFDYAYGTAGVPNTIWSRVVDGADISWWIPLGLISVIPGALIAAVAGNTLWVRGEQARRYVELIGGGLLMGIGAAIAGGCNLGHSMVGVPLLSIGSIVTTVAIAGGVFIGDRVARQLHR